MKHLENLTIHRFRGMEEMSFEGLGDVNVFVGKNNSGKTSVLEATSLLCNPINKSTWNLIAQHRTSPIPEIVPNLNNIKNLFPRSFANGELNKSDQTVFVSAQKKTSTLTLECSFEAFRGPVKMPEFITAYLGKQYDMPSPFQQADGVLVDVKITEKGGIEEHTGQRRIVFWEVPFAEDPVNELMPELPYEYVSTTDRYSSSNALQKAFTEAIQKDLKEDIIFLLRMFDSNIEDIAILNPSGDNAEFTLKHRILGFPPIGIFGDGVLRLFRILLSIVHARGGVLLIDEVETAIHTEALQNSFLWIIKAAREMDVQLFLSTHSLEAIDALLKSTTENSVDFVTYRLNQLAEDPKNRVKRSDKEQLEYLRDELGMDVRW